MEAAYTHLKDIADAMSKETEGLQALIGNINSMMKVASGFNKIKMDDTKKTLKSLSAVETFFKGFSSTISSICDIMINEMSKEIDKEKLDQLRDIFISKDTTTGPHGELEDGGIKYLQKKDAGLIEVITGVVGAASSLDSLKAPDAKKFKKNFNKTLKLFQWAFRRTLGIVDPMDAKRIKEFEEVTTSLKNVMQELPMSLELMVDMFKKSGKGGITATIGTWVVLGMSWSDSKVSDYSAESTNRPGGVLSALILFHGVAATIANSDVFKKFSTSVKAASLAIGLLLLTFTAALVLAIPAYLGMLIMFGVKGKGGLIGVFIRGLEYLAKQKKAIDDGGKEMLIIAAAVGALALAVAILALAGMVVTQNFAQIGLTILLLAAIVGAFMLVGLSTKWIERGGKEMLIIAATVGILALVTVMLALVGDLIMTNIAQFAITALFLLLLVGAFMLVGLASKWIESGGKEMLIIAAVVAILAVVAVILIMVGNLVQANWGALGAMALMMVVVTGMFIGIAWASKFINESWPSLLIIVGGILLISVATFIMMQAMSMGSFWDLLGAAAIMVGVVLAFAGVMWLLAGTIVPTTIGLVAFGMIVGGILLISIAMRIITNVIRDIKDMELDEKTLSEKMMIPINAVGAVLEASSKYGIRALFRAAIKIGLLSSIMSSVGRMANVLQHISSLNMPIEWDKNGNPKKYQAMKGDDFVKAATNATAIFRLAVGMLDDEPQEIVLGDGSKVTLPGFDSENLNKCTLGAAWKTRMLSKIVARVGDMADTLQHISSLNLPTEWNKDGKPVKFRPMDGNDFMNASLNAAALLHFWLALFNDGDTQLETSTGNYVVSGLDMGALDKMSLGMKWKVQRLGAVVNVVGGMADTLQHISSLTMPDPDTEFDENGKPKKWKLMTGDDFMNASLNAAALLHFFAALFGDEDVQLETSMGNFTISPIGKDALDNLTLGMKWKMQRLGAIVNVVGGMADTLQHISSLTMPDAEAEYDENGRPNKWKKMDSKDFATAATTAGDMLRFFVALFDEKDSTLMLGGQSVVVKPISQDALDNISRSTKKKMESIGASVAVVSGLAETMSNMGQCIIPDIQNPATDIDPVTGKPLKWKAMDLGQAVRDAESTIWLILSSITSILGDEQLSEDLDDLNEDALENMALAMDGISGLTGVVDIIKMLAGGGMPTRWIKDTDPKSPTYGQMIGDPSSYVDMGKWIASNYLNIKSTIKTLLMAPVYAIRDISQDKDFLEAINTSKVWGEDIIKVTNGVIKPTTELAKLYKDQLKDLNADDVRKVLTSIIGTPISILTQYAPDAVMQAKSGSLVVFERVVKAMSLVKIDDKTAKNYQTNVKETVGLLKQVQSVDLNKLKTVDSIMKHMAEMTKQIHGDFEGLAEVLSDELLEVLEKLTDTLEDIKNGGSAPKTSSFADLTPAKSGTQKVNEPKQDNKPNQTNKALAKDVADLRVSIDKIYKLLDNRTGFPVKLQR